MVRAVPSNAEGKGSIPGQGAKIPHASRPKNQNKPQNPQNRSNIITNSIKDFKKIK